ncbi:unnamed protein product [Amaranthus hypochondriacus]
MTTNEYLSGSLLGETRGTLEEMFELYKQHASLVGFSVRKGKHRMKQGTSDVNEKYYLCSAAGIRNTVKKVVKETQSHDTEGTEKTKIRKERRVVITRTGCNACIRAKKNTFGLFEVIDHVLAHNHSMTRTQWNYRQRSERQMSAEAGGEYTIGHTVKNHLNFCHKLKMKKIDGGDANSVIE